MQTALNEFGAGWWELVAVSMGDMGYDGAEVDL